jgi:hypothetical protein
MNKDKASYVIDEIQRINDNINSMIVDGSICLDDYSSETLRGIDKLSSDSKELRELIMDSPDSLIIQKFKNLNYTNIVKFHELSPGYLKYEYILQLSEFVDNIKDIKDFIETSIKKPLYNKPEHLPNKLGNDKTEKLYNDLIKNDLINNTTSKEDFLYWFGCSVDVPNELSQIQWTAKRGYKVLLSYLIANIYIDEFPNKQACIAFGEKSLKQLQFQYSGNTKDGGKPKKHLLIDNILKNL